MKELFEIYFIFFKLGIMNFGGGYALLPLLDRELVQRRGWTTESELTDYYAIGQCTPGAFAVNISTFIGIKRKGTLGGIIATLGFVSPAFIIVFIIASLLSNFASNAYVMNALAGIRCCVLFLVLYAVSKLVKNAIKDWEGAVLAGVIAVLAVTVSAIPLYVYVIFAACYGIFISWLRHRHDEKEEKVEQPKEKKKEIRPVLRKTLVSVSSFFLGFLTGILSLITFPFVKNETYRKSVSAGIVPAFVFHASLLTFIFTGNSIVFTLFLQFFKIGICAFGGGLATIPFLNELSQTSGWFSEMDLANMIAVSESTPGAMGINMSTYVGYTVLQNTFGNYGLSFLGSIISTLGLVFPSIIVITVVAYFLEKFKNNKYVDWAFYGLRAASIGLILAAVYSIVKVSVFKNYETATGDSMDAISYAWSTAFAEVTSVSDFFSDVANFFNLLFSFKALAVGLLFGIGIFKFKKHPIIYIAIAAVVGILLQMHEIIIV